jgi:serine/threonine protein phosphatase PrpC
LTEIGAVRESHEDAIVVGGTMAAASGARIGGVGPVGPSGLVFAVVDGMGGYAGGAAAAGLVGAGLAGVASGVAPGGWRAWLKTMSDRVSAAGRAWGTAEMGATAVILVVRPHRVEVVNVGDCRAYRIANGQVDQLSVDDRVATPRGDAVTQALGGASRPIDPHEMEAPLPEAPTRFVLCSDGLFGALAPEELASLLVRPGRPEEIADALADAAYRRQSRDNFSLIVISVRPGAALAVPSPDPEDTVVNLSLPPIPPMR